jgi:hypothetical protein
MLSFFNLLKKNLYISKHTEPKFEYLNMLTVVSAVTYMIFFSIGPGIYF